MQYKKNYAESFKYALMFGKNIHPQSISQTSVADKNDVFLAIKKAYIDMTPRTFDSKNKRKGILNQEDKEKLFLLLAEKFVEYIKSNSLFKTFDKWHEKMCKLFIKGNESVKGLEQILCEADKKSEKATFGKAQKLVNMTFKYLYCFDDAQNYIEKFEPCHMPLDHFILDWFFDWYKPIWEKENFGKKFSKTGKYKLPKWSDLKYRKENGEVIPQYSEIQSEIKKRLNIKNVCRLEAEFVIWHEARFCLKFSY